MILALDPGDKHVGWAGVFTDEKGQWDWDKRMSKEYDPEDCLEMLKEMSVLGEPKFDVEVLIVEEFRLYPWRAREQSFSEFKTPEMIGQLKLWQRWFSPHTEIIMQPATIKIPTFKIMKGRGIGLTKGSQHTKDAEAHLYHHLVRTGVSSIERKRKTP